eukprot:g17109.t1
MSTQPDIQTVLANARDIALELSRSAVTAFEGRCALTKSECEGLHFSACRSRLPDGECTSNALTPTECLGSSCGSVQDFSNPVVQIPASLQSDGNEVTNLDVIETICYGTILDDPLVEQFEESQSPDEVSSVFTYFGSWTGVMRIFPGASLGNECGDYDPRIRPWYVAASSGPKDVVIVVDISGSMLEQGRFDLAIDAVTSVLGTMNEHTFVNIVIFEGNAKVLTSESLLVPATDENKAMLLELFAEVRPEGSTNFEEAMTAAFELLEASRALGDEASSECSTAILLLTDGEITEGLGVTDPSEVSDYVHTLNTEIEAQIFTFALGPDADSATLKTIACGSRGIFQAVPDGGSLSTAMSFYYRYYAIGLGGNTDYTAYSSLYEFSAGTGGGLGFTVASPAYDQAFDPPAFLGVSGVDFTLQSFLKLGFSQGAIEDAVYLGGRECPGFFNLTSCQLQKFRGSISTESVCDDDVSSCDSTSVPLESARCMEEEEYPDNLWSNEELAGMSFLDRNCCPEDTYDPSLATPTCEIAGGGAVLANARDVALELSRSAVEAFESRCALTKSECERLHFSACRSRLPDGECTSNALTPTECLGSSCGSVQDFSNPVVQIPASLQSDDNKVSNLDVIETICYGTILDDPLVKQYEQSQSPDEISSVFTYFGSWTGVMRIFPGASLGSECGDYDPRVRPWYVAASSGPKDVVIVVDISGSMVDNGRFELATEAVEAVLDTMNEHTFVNIVLFSGDAEVLTSESLLVPATDENKAMLLDLFDEVETEGSTNFEVAMTMTFSLLAASQALGDEASSECSTAILFLSDGTITQGLGMEDPSEVVGLVETLNVDIDAQIFTFALGPDADAATLKTIACGSGGIFQAVPDGGALSSAMSFYYRFYAIGLGSSTDYTAYSSLYEFSDGTGGELGFTVASPAYDQAFDPPAFLGVSGVDFTLQSFLDLGFSQGAVEDAVFLGGKECPAGFNLTSCQLQRFRGSISTESVCDDDGSCGSTNVSLEPVRCMAEDEYPDNLWSNEDLAGEVALELSKSAVNAFESRCALTKSECEGLHFSACRSRLPNGECTSNALTPTDCLESSCGSVQDFSNPVVQIPASLQSDDNEVSNLDVIETICYGVILDAPLKEQFEQSQSPEAVSSVFTYFGSWTGVMRIFPGESRGKECGDYDPRVRPWYVAASSGPKDVVIIVDISGSMLDNGRFDLAKEAVKAVLDTMNEHTFVNVVLFSDDAEVLTPDSLLVPATDDNKAMLVDLFDKVGPDGPTNFEEAMKTTFSLLEESRALGDKASSECSTAILFLSDGEITLGLGLNDPSEITDYIETLNAEIEAQIFTFSLGPDADAATLKTIACGSGGIFQAVPDGGSLSTAMSFYYRYYAIGLGSNTDYTAYSSVYEFAASGEPGFTVASPAYDQAFDPPAFLGVSGVDFTLQSLLDLGFSESAIRDAVYLGGKECPASFNLTSCQLQQFRGSIATESVCEYDDSCGSTNVSLEPARCMAEDEYPENLWSNEGLAGLNFVERNCCEQDNFNPSVPPVCELPGGDGSNTTTIVVAVVAVGHIGLFRWLVKEGVNDVNDTCVKEIMTPLFPATEYAGADMVKTVLGAGGDIRFRTIEGWTPIHAAPRLCNVRIIKAFLRAVHLPRRMTLVQGAAYGLDVRSLSKLLGVGAVAPFTHDGRAAEHVDLFTPSDAHLPPKDPVRKAAMHRIIARRSAFTATSWLWAAAARGQQQRDSPGHWVLQPRETWLSLLECFAFEVVLLFLCFHQRGPALAKSGPSIVGRWLTPSVNDAGVVEPISISPALSVAQRSSPGALHEGFVRGARAGDEAILKEAGAVLEVGRSITAEELLSVARDSERPAYRSRCYVRFSACLILSGVIATIGLWLLRVTAPHEDLEEAILAVVRVLHVTPSWLLCLVTLTISMALVCDGFRAPDTTIGGRIALAGVAAAIVTMLYRCAPIAVKFDFYLGGFMAVVSAFYCAVFIPARAAWLNAYMLGAMVVNCLFGLAVVLRLKIALQMLVLLGLLAGWLVGKAIGCDGLVNNTILFGALYVFATTIISASESATVAGRPDGLRVSRTASVAMGTSVSKPIPTSSLKSSSESDANDTHDGGKVPPRLGHQHRPLEQAASIPPDSVASNAHHAPDEQQHPDHQSRSVSPAVRSPPEIDANYTHHGAEELAHPDRLSHSLVDKTTCRIKGKGKGKGKGKTRTNTDKRTPTILPRGQEAIRLAKADTARQTPMAAASAAAPAAAAAAAATAPHPGKFTYEAVAPFLRSEGWNCADGHGFHTWFFVTRAADGKKSVDYLVSKKDVVDFVKRDRSVLARYEAYRQRGGGETVAPIGRSTQDDGGGVYRSSGRVVVGASSSRERRVAGRRCGGARGASSPRASVRARGRSEGIAVAKGGSGISARVTRRVKEETPGVGVRGASTKRARFPRGAPVSEVVGASKGGGGDDRRSVKEEPVARATRMSTRCGRSAKYNSLVKPALSISTVSTRTAKTSPASKTTGGSAGGKKASTIAPIAQKVEPTMESGRSTKNKPGTRAASPGPPAVKHNAVVRAAVAAAVAAERSAGVDFHPVKQRAQSGDIPQEESPHLQRTVDWAGRETAKAPTQIPPSSPATAIFSRAEAWIRPSAESKRRSSSAPAPPNALQGGWAGAACSQARDQQLQAQQRQLAGPLGYRKRSRGEASCATSWRETWPTLREEGWHWEFGEDLGASCVYLKPGVSREGATLGVDMFDSKRAVLQHVLDTAEGSAALAAAAAAAAAGDSACPPVDRPRSASSAEGAVGGRARTSHGKTKTRFGDNTLAVGEGARRRDHKLHQGGSHNDVPVPISSAAGWDERPRKGNVAAEADAPPGVGDGGPSANASFLYSLGTHEEMSGGCAGRGSPIEELEQRNEEGRGNDWSINVRTRAPARCLARRGTVGGAPGRSYQPRSAADMRTNQPSKNVGSGEDSPADNEDDIELAASVVMEMLRAEPGEAAEPAAKRRSTGSSSSSSARGRHGSASDTAGTAPWGLDEMTAHCCKQLVALSELGGAASGVHGKHGDGGGSDVDGVDRTLKRKTPAPDSPPAVSWSSERGSESSKKIRNGVRAAVAAATSPGSPLGSARRNESAKMRDGDGGGDGDGVPAVEENEIGAPGTSALGRSGPLSGVGVIVAGLRGEAQKEVEAEIMRLGGEVEKVFSANGVADKWSVCPVGGAGPDMEGGSAAASQNGKGSDDGPSPSPPLKMISVAAPGGDRTPEFQLAVAAGMPILHPSYLGACSQTGARVETAGYLMPYARSALGNRGLIMPPLRSSKGRPFQGKTIILCVNESTGTGGETTAEDWVVIFRVAGATVKVLEDGGNGGGRGVGGSSGVGPASATVPERLEAVNSNRCTVEVARKLITEGRVYCVVGPSIGGAPRATSTTAAAALQAAIDAGTLTGTLEWAAQCMVHGRVLLPTADTCPWFPAGVAVEGGAGDRAISTNTSGDGGVPEREARGSAGERCRGKGAAGVFHVHASGGRRYIAGDYVFLGNQPEFSTSCVAGGASRETAAEKGEAERGEGGSGEAAGGRPVGRIVSFRREVDGAVKVTVDVLGRATSGEGNPKVLVEATSGGAEQGRGDPQQEVDEGDLGGRVTVLTRGEAEAARLYSSNDSDIFFLGKSLMALCLLAHEHGVNADGYETKAEVVRALLAAGKAAYPSPIIEPWNYRQPPTGPPFQHDELRRRQVLHLASGAISTLTQNKRSSAIAAATRTSSSRRGAAASPPHAGRSSSTNAAARIFAPSRREGGSLIAATELPIPIAATPASTPIAVSIPGERCCSVTITHRAVCGSTSPNGAVASLPMDEELDGKTSMATRAPTSTGSGPLGGCARSERSRETPGTSSSTREDGGSSPEEELRAPITINTAAGATTASPPRAVVVNPTEECAPSKRLRETPGDRASPDEAAAIPPPQEQEEAEEAKEEGSRAMAHPAALRSLAQFVPDTQYLFFATVCKGWRAAWGDRPTLTSHVSPDSSLSQLRYSIANGLPKRGVDLCTSLSRLGKLDLVRYSRTKGYCYNWNWRTTATLARAGDLKLLKMAVRNGCEWNQTTTAPAARRGHVGLEARMPVRRYALREGGDGGAPVHPPRRPQARVPQGYEDHHVGGGGRSHPRPQWARRNGCRWKLNKCYKNAGRHGHKHVLEWIENLRRWCDSGSSERMALGRRKKAEAEVAAVAAAAAGGGRLIVT